ncbi:MAG TPA: hypothetical protein DEB31_08615 [Clostridiales bacterium]|nr:hypothetical protein [Clostridiales bacterium]
MNSKLFTIGAVLSGCAAQEGLADGTEAQPEAVTLSFMMPQTHHKDFFQELIRQFMKAFREVCRVLKQHGIVPLYVSDKDAWTAQFGFDSAAPQAVPAGVWQDIQSNRVRWADVPEFVTVPDTMAALRFDGFTNADYMDATCESAVTEMAGENAAMYITGGFFIHDALPANPDIELSLMAMPYHGDSLTVIQGPGQFSVHLDLS